MSSVPQAYVIHENDEWVVPLREQLTELGVPFTEWFAHEGRIDLDSLPPAGVFYNRMSASSHTRGHRYAPEHTAALLAWLSRHGKIVVNGERALQLEVSKVAQYQALQSFDIPTPKTHAVIGIGHLSAACEQLGYPVILKHNRAGKGLGVKLIESGLSLKEHLASEQFENSIDGIMLVQQYVKAPEPFITRVEFVGGRFLYAVRVNTSEGFELCPADVCEIEATPNVCPATAADEKFQIVEGFDHPLIPKWELFLKASDIGVAGIEFIVDQDGQSYTYDVNTNTNYNQKAESVGSVPTGGMRAIAIYLKQLLSLV